MTNISQEGLHYSVIRHLKERLGLRVDWKYDGYEMPEGETLITVEQMQNNYEYIVKLRESVQVTHRFQVGLHALSSRERSLTQEEMRRIFMFDLFLYYNTNETPAKSDGCFSVELTSEVPMPADDISNKSGYHTIYFDIEIDAINRR